jgi:hypothetical protein
MTITITDVRNQLNVAVEEYGEEWISRASNVYEQDGETRMCLAAKVLNLMGVEEAGLASVDGECDIQDTVQSLGVDIDDNAIKFLVKAQSLQDDGWPWGAVQRRCI